MEYIPLEKAELMINSLHKNKEFRPTDEECQFLEDISFNLYVGAFVSEKDKEHLQVIYKKSQEQ